MRTHVPEHLKQDSCASLAQVALLARQRGYLLRHPAQQRRVRSRHSILSPAQVQRARNRGVAKQLA